MREKAKKLLTGFAILCIVFVGAAVMPKDVQAAGDFVIENGVLTQCNSTDSHVTIPDGVTKIGDDAFLYLMTLNEVTIPDSVTEIGARAFSMCTGLSSVTIPDSVTKMGEAAFSMCTGLSSVTLSNNLTTISDSAFLGCPITSVTIPAKVTKIEEAAFGMCTNLSSVTIPGNVTEIGSLAFYQCAGLSNVTISNGVRKIGNDAFSECTGLSSVTIAGSVTEIGENAFWGCGSLTDITIPGSVTKIGCSAFTGTKWLNAKRQERKDHLVIINHILIDGISAGGNVTIPDGVTSINPEAFSGCSALTGVTVPDSVLSIAERAFSQCTNITQLTILNPKVKFCSPDLQIFGIGEGSAIKFANSVITIKGYEKSTAQTLYEHLKSWASSSWIDGTVKFTALKKNETAGTVTAGKKYKITFNVNGGNALKTKTKTVTAGKTYGTLPDAKRKGYTFSGWFTAKSGGKKISKSTKVTISKNTTLYAHWKKVTRPANVKKPVVKNRKKNTITVTCRKVAGAAGYEIRYAVKSNMKGAQKVTAKKTSVTIKNKKLKKGSACYVQVRAFKKDSTGRKIYSRSYSSKAKIRITK